MKIRFEHQDLDCVMRPINVGEIYAWQLQYRHDSYSLYLNLLLGSDLVVALMVY